MSDPGSMSDSAESGGAVGGDEEKPFSAQTISLRAQKKLVSKLASKKAVKVFIDATSARIFDRIYRIVKLHSGSRSKAQKLMKRIIKINMKVGVLYINDILDDEEKELADEFRDKFNDLATALVRMHVGKQPVDTRCLVAQFRQCEALVLRMIRRHLSDKSQQSVRACGEFFTDAAFLAAVFNPNSPLAPEMDAICDDIQELLDRGLV